MLSHPRCELWQLLDLVSSNKNTLGALTLAERVATRAPLGPVLNNLVDHLGRQQLATMPLMTRLRALPALRALLAPLP
jgi:hypothetical protein